MTTTVGNTFGVNVGPGVGLGVSKRSLGSTSGVLKGVLRGDTSGDTVPGCGVLGVGISGAAGSACRAERDTRMKAKTRARMTSAAKTARADPMFFLIVFPHFRSFSHPPQNG